MLAANASSGPKFAFNTTSAPQPNPRPLAVGELDAGSLQRLPHLLDRLSGNVAALTEEPPRCSALSWRQEIFSMGVVGRGYKNTPAGRGYATSQPALATAYSSRGSCDDQFPNSISAIGHAP